MTFPFAEKQPLSFVGYYLPSKYIFWLLRPTNLTNHTTYKKILSSKNTSINSDGRIFLLAVWSFLILIILTKYTRTVWFLPPTAWLQKYTLVYKTLDNSKLEFINNLIGSYVIFFTYPWHRPTWSIVPNRHSNCSFATLSLIIYDNIIKSFSEWD